MLVSCSMQTTFGAFRPVGYWQARSWRHDSLPGLLRMIVSAAAGRAGWLEGRPRGRLVVLGRV
jgi:hypothetical protein